MHVYEVTPGIYKIFSKIASLKTYRHGYFIKQQNENGYFCGMTLHRILFVVDHSNTPTTTRRLTWLLLHLSSEGKRGDGSSSEMSASSQMMENLPSNKKSWRLLLRIGLEMMLMSEVKCQFKNNLEFFFVFTKFWLISILSMML